MTQRRTISTILFLCALGAALLAAGCAAPRATTAAADIAEAEEDTSGADFPYDYVIAPDTGRKAAERYFMEGTLRTLAGDYRGGIGCYQAVLRSIPDHPPSLEAIARNRTALEEYDSALFYARRAVQADPHDVESRRLLAELWIVSGMFDSAAAEYERLLAQRPNDLQARYTIARTWERRNPARALEHYLYIRDNLAEDFNTLMGLYEIYARRSDYDGAAAAVRLLLYHAPEDPALYELLCGIWTDAGRYDSASRVLQEAGLYIEEAEQLEPFLLAMLSVTELRLRGFGAVSEDFQRFADSLVRVTARRLPERPKPLYNAGMIALRLGDAAAGDTLLARAFRSDEPNDFAWTEAATLYADRGDHTRLLAVLGPYAARAAAGAEVCYRTALAFDETGKKDSAIFYLNKALQADPEYGNAWSALARMQVADGKSGAAIASYENAVGADPYNPETLNDYAVTLLLLGVHREKAKAMAERALRIEPENERYLTTRGRIAYLEKDYDAAVEYLQRAVKAGGATADRLELLGDSYIAEGEAEQGRRAYERALRVADVDSGQAERLQRKMAGEL